MLSELMLFSLPVLLLRWIHLYLPSLAKQCSVFTYTLSKMVISFDLCALQRYGPVPVVSVPVCSIPVVWSASNGNIWKQQNKTICIGLMLQTFLTCECCQRIWYNYLLSVCIELTSGNTISLKYVGVHVGDTQTVGHLCRDLSICIFLSADLLPAFFMLLKPLLGQLDLFSFEGKPACSSQEDRVTEARTGRTMKNACFYKYCMCKACWFEHALLHQSLTVIELKGPRLPEELKLTSWSDSMLWL